MVYKSVVSGPKWANFKKFLHQMSWHYGLDLKITDHDKGWIRETIYFQIEGEEEKVNKAVRVLAKSVDAYNKD